MLVDLATTSSAPASRSATPSSPWRATAPRRARRATSARCWSRRARTPSTSPAPTSSACEPEDVPTLAAARKRGYIPADAPKTCPSPGRCSPCPDFKLVTERSSLEFTRPIPGPLGALAGKAMRRLMRARPALAARECVGCGQLRPRLPRPRHRVCARSLPAHRPPQVHLLLLLSGILSPGGDEGAPHVRRPRAGWRKTWQSHENYTEGRNRLADLTLRCIMKMYLLAAALSAGRCEIYRRNGAVCLHEPVGRNIFGGGGTRSRKAYFCGRKKALEARQSPHGAHGRGRRRLYGAGGAFCNIY